jgi:CTD small phosphatase-like protein 2
MSNYYELVVFTAGLKDYADWILNDFDKQGLISYRLYRHHTRFRSGVYVKDLSKLGRSLTKTIIIDNIQENFMLQHENGIHIRGWYNDPLDRELEKLTPFLKGIVQKGSPDVRVDLRSMRYHASPETKHIYSLDGILGSHSLSDHKRP